MEGTDKNFLRNMFKIFYWAQEDKDMSTQVLEFDKDGEKLYFKPVTADLDHNNLTGIFLPDKKSAMMMKGFEETINVIPDLDYISEFEKLDINGLIWKLEPGENGKVEMRGSGLGKYKDDILRTEFFDSILNFLNQGDVNFHSLNRDNATDLELDEAQLQELLSCALAFYHYASKAAPQQFFEMKSPGSDKSTIFSLIDPSVGIDENNAVFAVFPNGDKLESFINNIYDVDNPAEVGKAEDFMFIEIYPKEGTYQLNDIPNGNLVNLDEEGKREYIKNFLTILKEVYDYGMTQ